MIFPWGPVVVVDIVGSIVVLLFSALCARLSWQLSKEKPDDVFRSYIFLFTLAILFFAVSRSFGHLVKQLLLLNDLDLTWKLIAPYSGAVNSTAFVVIFAFGISFHRFQTVHTEIEYYKSNLEELIALRTEELENSRNTLQNILNNSNPINITEVNFNLVQANAAYYSLWPKTAKQGEVLKCYESRPGGHCHTEDCPLKLIIDGHDEVIQEVTKNLGGEVLHFIVTARPFKDLDGKLLGMVESFQNITLRKQAEKAMRESEERFRKIFESNPDPVILAEMVSGNIIDVNKAFEQATGIKRAVAIGHNSENLGFWADQEARKLFREIIQEHGEASNYEADFRLQNGQIKTGLISASALRVNREPCFLLVIRDITKEKTAERTLVEMDRVKSEFISTAAHELSTPLSSIMGFTEFLRNPDDFGDFSEDQRKDFIDEIYNNSETLNRIIEDLLDISRIESGKPIPLILKETNIIEVLRKKLYSVMMQNPDYTFNIDLPGNSRKEKIPIDHHRINQVLDNLFSNAIKYSPKDTEISLTAIENADGWEVKVEDQGVGMNEEQRDHIFDKFYRADASNTAVGGLGLGMNIVKQVIEAHSGAIWVESSEGEGTAVFFKLPFEVQPAQ